MSVALAYRALFLAILVLPVLTGCGAEEDARGPASHSGLRQLALSATAEDLVDSTVPVVDQLGSSAADESGWCASGWDSTTASAVGALADELGGSGALGESVTELAALTAAGAGDPAEVLARLAQVVPDIERTLEQRSDPCAATFSRAFARLGTAAPQESRQESQPSESIASDGEAVAVAFGLHGDEAACVAGRLALATADHLAVLVAHSQCANNR